MTRSRDVSAVQNNLGVAIPPAAAGKNSVLNSGMDFWQRGTSIACSASVVYSADRWESYRGSYAAGLTVSRQATGDTTNLPNIQYCARVQRDSGNTSTAAMNFNQPFETVNSIPFAGQTVTLSFYARKGANFSQVSSLLTAGINTGTGTDQTMRGGYTGGSVLGSTTFTLTTTWQKFSLTASIPSTVTELGPQFSYGPSGTAGAADYFEVTGVQLEKGNTATPYMRNNTTYQAELAACQRYYFRNTADASYTYFGWGSAYSTTAAVVTINLPVTMRTMPSSLEWSGVQVSDTNGQYTPTALAINQNSKQTPLIAATGMTGLTQYRPYTFNAGNSAATYIALSAEL